MKDLKKLFHRVSYLQYPLMLLGLFYCYHPYIVSDYGLIWIDFNKGLVFFGLGISMSTLQDTTKTQNSLSRRIYESPKKSRIFLLVLAAQAILFIALGMFAFFGSLSPSFKELAFGLLALGVGMIGILKSAAEMAENFKKE